MHSAVTESISKSSTGSAKPKPSNKKYPAPLPPTSQQPSTNSTPEATALTAAAASSGQQAAAEGAATAAADAAGRKKNGTATSSNMTVTTSGSKSEESQSSPAKKNAPTTSSASPNKASNASKNTNYVRPPMQVMPISRNTSAEDDKEVVKFTGTPVAVFPMSSCRGKIGGKTDTAMRNHAAALESLNKQFKSTSSPAVRNSRNSADLSRQNCANVNNVIYDEPNVNGANSRHIKIQEPAEMVISDGYIQLRTSQNKPDSNSRPNSNRQSINSCDSSDRRNSSTSQKVQEYKNVIASLDSKGENRLVNNSKLTSKDKDKFESTSKNCDSSNTFVSNQIELKNDEITKSGGGGLVLRPSRRAPPPPFNALRKPVVSDVKLVSRDSIKRRTATLGSKLRAYRSTNALDHVELLFDTEDEVDSNNVSQTEESFQDIMTKEFNAIRDFDKYIKPDYILNSDKTRHSDVVYASPGGSRQVESGGRSSFVDPDGPKRACRSVYIDLGEYQTLLKHSRHEERRHYALPQPHCYSDDTLKAVKMITEKYDTFKRRQLQAASFRGGTGVGALGSITDQDDGDVVDEGLMRASGDSRAGFRLSDLRPDMEERIMEESGHLSSSGLGVMDPLKVEQILQRDYFTDRSSCSVNDADQTSYMLGGLTHLERLRIAMFYRSKDTVIYVCSSLADLFVGTPPAEVEPKKKASEKSGESSSKRNTNQGEESSPSGEETWIHAHTGVPVWVLNTGEGVRPRKLGLILADRESGFTLWEDKINCLSEYKSGETPATQTMRVSTNPLSKAVKLSMYCEEAGQRFLRMFHTLGADPDDEIWMISEKEKQKSKNRNKKKNAALSNKPPDKLDTGQSSSCRRKNLQSKNSQSLKSEVRTSADKVARHCERVSSNRVSFNDVGNGYMTSTDDESEEEGLLDQIEVLDDTNTDTNTRNKTSNSVNVGSSEALDSLSCSVFGRWRQSKRWKKPDKSTISQPCNFVHINSIDPHSESFRATFADCLPLDASINAGQIGSDLVIQNEGEIEGTAVDTEMGQINNDEEVTEFRPRLPTR